MRLRANDTAAAAIAPVLYKSTCSEPSREVFSHGGPCGMLTNSRICVSSYRVYMTKRGSGSVFNVGGSSETIRQHAQYHSSASVPFFGRTQHCLLVEWMLDDGFNNNGSATVDDTGIALRRASAATRITGRVAVERNNSVFVWNAFNVPSVEKTTDGKRQ